MAPVAPGRRVLRAAGATDIGRMRVLNEDRFHVDAARGIFIVVDGMGGHAAGDQAAERAIAAIRERLGRETGAVPDRVREAITIANNEIHRAAALRPEWHGMACVLTVAVLDGDRAVVGHVGDSRLYRIAGEKIEKITPDHSPVGEREDARELSEQQAMQHPRRHEVYRDVGSAPRLVTDETFVFVTEIDLPADAALLICSDGLTDQVPAERIRQVARAHARSPDQVVRTLIDEANAAGGKDNVTVVFVPGERFARRAAAATGRRSKARWLIGPLVVAALAAAFLLGRNWHRLDWAERGAGLFTGRLLAPAGTIVVRAGDSIMEAIGRAGAGSTVVIEPGEYRERLTLKDGVRVISRVPRAATLRLPEGATDRDPAVIATGIVEAEMAGLRIVGDAATPLGIAVLARDAGIRLVDVEVSGAAAVAIDLGRGDGVVLSGSHIHDNPGPALIVRSGATPRLSHNAFARNASSERAAAAFVLEQEARATWAGNVFLDIGPEAIAGIDEPTRAALRQENWFLTMTPTSPRGPAGRGGRQ
jgi:serine/threonine protein phosphatase PrpC